MDDSLLWILFHPLFFLLVPFNELYSPTKLTFITPYTWYVCNYLLLSGKWYQAPLESLNLSHYVCNGQIGVILPGQMIIRRSVQLIPKYCLIVLFLLIYVHGLFSSPNTKTLSESGINLATPNVLLCNYTSEVNGGCPLFSMSPIF